VEVVTTVETTAVTTEEVDVMVVSPVEVETTVEVCGGAPPTVVTLVVVTAAGGAILLCPAKYAIAPTATAATMAAPIIAMLPRAFLRVLTTKTPRPVYL